MLSDFCGLENVLVFVCVQTRLWSGLVFVLLMALSDVYILGNCLCSAGEKGSRAGVPGSSGSQGLSASSREGPVSCPFLSCLSSTEPSAWHPGIVS